VTTTASCSQLTLSRRKDRNKLLLHILRLRPSPEQLLEWNNNVPDPSQTHIKGEWTQWLKKLAPPDFVDDIDNVKPEKVEQRRKHLEQLYTVADMEEKYEEFGMGK
jgi:hypothetical protein